MRVIVCGYISQGFSSFGNVSFLHFYILLSQNGLEMKSKPLSGMPQGFSIIGNGLFLHSFIILSQNGLEIKSIFKQIIIFFSFPDMDKVLISFGPSSWVHAPV